MKSVCLKDAYFRQITQIVHILENAPLRTILNANGGKRYSEVQILDNLNSAHFRQGGDRKLSMHVLESLYIGQSLSAPKSEK